MPYVLDRPLYLTCDKKRVVEEEDPEAAFVLGGKGSTIPDEQARELGLLNDESKAGLAAEDNKAILPRQNKARAK